MYPENSLLDADSDVGILVMSIQKIIREKCNHRLRNAE